ncbi:MAG: ABC transporter permease [Opitutales bacterium]
MSALPQRALPAVVFGLCLLAAWYGAIWVFSISPFLLPAPHDILLAAWEKRSTLWISGCITGLHALVGFSLAVSVGFILAVPMTLFGTVRRAVYPYVTALQMVPVITLIPILVRWFDYGMGSVAAITFLISFFPVVVNTTTGLLNVDEDLLDLFRLYDANRWQELWLLRVPHSLPYFIAGVRIAATLAPIGAITGDLFAGSIGEDAGLGYLVQLYQGEGFINGVFAVVIFSSLLGFAFVAVVLALSNLLLKRHGEA